MNDTKYLNVINKKITYLPKNKRKYQNIKYNFEKILNYKEYKKIIQKLNLSKYIKVAIIGKSIDQRNVYSLEIGNGENIILFDAGTHAREVANPLFLLKYCIDLINKLEKKQKELNNIKLIIVPLVNPDGYDAVLFGPKSINNKKLHIYKKRNLINFNTYKANSNGVDINRNFPSQHSGLHYRKYLSQNVSYKPSLGYEDFYSGYQLGSEEETQALIYLFNKYIYNIKVYITLHSAGRLIYSGKPNLSNVFNNNSLKLAKYISKINNYLIYDKNEEEVGNGTDGTSTDYLSELASGFKFSTITGRLSADSYKAPNIKNAHNIGIVTLETLEDITFNIKKIKAEYYNKKFEKLFNKIIELYYI
ncbi:MAG: M14 family zinc carboxypeptidase [Bacilli bacterium]|nr:M14 family zinc carboxypeptidase [Bacilli bacterium]MDD4406814.1 M14 family zinc carboxypeptidase [Bacilli bacterium]